MASRTSDKSAPKTRKTAKSAKQPTKRSEKKTVRKAAETPAETAKKSGVKTVAKPSKKPTTKAPKVSPKKPAAKRTAEKKTTKTVAKKSPPKSEQARIDKGQAKVQQAAPPAVEPEPVVQPAPPPEPVPPAAEADSPAGVAPEVSPPPASAPPVFVKRDLVGPDGSKRPGWEMWIGDHCFGRADDKALLLASFERLQSPPSSFHWREVRNRMPMRARGKLPTDPKDGESGNGTEGEGASKDSKSEVEASKPT